MSAVALRAHSLAEAYLYLMATPCAACGKGPLRGGDAVRVGTGPVLIMRIDAVCAACHGPRQLHFQLTQGLGTTGTGAPAVVNASDEPSEIIDVAQWITLARVIAEAAGRETNKGRARHLGLEAAQCFEEALKFFEDFNDVPPQSAFLLESSRQHFREHPEQFSRQRLVERRAKLPSTQAMRARIAHAPKRRWWPFGKR